MLLADAKRSSRADFDAFRGVQWSKRGAADRGIEDLDRMGGGQLLAALSQDLLNLQSAAGIGAGEKIGVRGENVHDLACTDLVGALRLDQVVDSSAAAALIAVGNLHELKLRNSAKELPWGRTNPLRMREVTGVVISDARLHSMPRGQRWQPREKLGDVFDLFREAGSALRPLRIIRQDAADVLRVRSTPCGIHDDRVDAGRLERRDERSSEAHRFFIASRVHGERAAAALS